MVDVVDDVIDLTRDSLVSADVRLVRNVEPDLPCVLADNVQLQQVVLNLLMNGIEAMANTASTDRKLVLSVVRQGSSLAVSVTDSGSGVAPSDMERMFDAFYTTKLDGLGMGLAISRSIIESHGGRMWANANKDFGLTVHFSLPISGLSEA